MKVSDYEGAVDLWKAQLVIGMCKGFGFKGADLEDAVQDMMIVVLGFRYDAAKANGRNERAALNGLLRRKLANMYRAERNRQRKFKTANETLCSKIC